MVYNIQCPSQIINRGIIKTIYPEIFKSDLRVNTLFNTRKIASMNGIMNPIKHLAILNEKSLCQDT